MDITRNAQTYSKANPPTRIDLAQRLSNGEPAQAILDDVVAYIVASDLAEPLLMAVCISFLAGNGARVATEEPGCAFETLIRKIDSTRIGFFLGFLTSRLAEHSGELPFHLMARHYPVQSFGIMWNPPQYQASLHARDSKGRTVSHYLWDEQSLVVRKHQVAQIQDSEPAFNNYNERKWYESVRMAWGLQDQLQKAGFGMDIPDTEGCTAMDLCVKRLRAKQIELIEDFDVCKSFEARISQRDLMTNTGPVEPPPTRPGPRL